MISAADYRDYVRVVDHHGIMHLALLSMDKSTVFCGSPPVGCTWADPVGELALPGDRTPAHRALCPWCQNQADPPHVGVDAELS